MLLYHSGRRFVVSRSEASELRSRTRALAEDLLRQAPAKGSSAPSAETGHHPDGAHTDAAPARTLAEISALRHQVNSLQGMCHLPSVEC